MRRETDESWWDEQPNKAKPPLWRAISDETDEGILYIAKQLLEILNTRTKVKNDSPLGIFSNRDGDIRQIAQIKSVQEKVKEVLGNPSIYPRGKARTPMKDKLNAGFSGQTYAIASAEEAELLKPVRGFTNIVGYDKVKSVKLYFPKNNKALNKLIYMVLGDEANDYQTPKAISGEAKPGVVLKTWESIITKHDKIGKQTDSVADMLQKRIRCHNPQCPHGPRNSNPEVTINQAKNCQYKISRGCVGYRR
jgi:hypothetical protein